MIFRKPKSRNGFCVCFGILISFSFYPLHLLFPKKRVWVKPAAGNFHSDMWYFSEMFSCEKNEKSVLEVAISYKITEWYLKSIAPVNLYVYSPNFLSWNIQNELQSGEIGKWSTVEVLCSNGYTSVLNFPNLLHWFHMFITKQCNVRRNKWKFCYLN